MNPNLQNRVMTLKLRAEDLQAQISQTEILVGQAKSRLEQKESVQLVLDELLARNHARTVGIYEILLTAIRQDVLPKEDGKIALEVFSERGLPALDIKIVNDGNVESLISGSGNSLKNVVCAGLRYVALARSQNRRFLVLDEADCWLRHTKVENFAMVAHKMSTELQVQTFMISHNDITYFEKYASVINLQKNDDDRIEAAPGGLSFEWQLGQKGIRSIRLKGLQSHEDTKIELSPFLNVVTGENEIGKTAIAFALRAVGYGESSDTLIRHGVSQCQVELVLEDDLRLRWTRVRKGSPKVVYELFDAAGTLLHRTPAPALNTTPDWVQDVLGISKIDGMDVQVGNNLSSIFLIDKPCTQQAAILSVGREISALFAMIDRYKKWVADDSKLVKEGEARIIAMTQKIADINLPEKLDKFEKLSMQKNAIDSVELNCKRIEKLLSNLPNLVTFHPKDVVAPALLPAVQLERQAEQLTRAQCIANIIKPKEIDSTAISANMVKFQRVSKLHDDAHPLSVMPTLKNLPAKLNEFEIKPVVSIINLGMNLAKLRDILPIADTIKNLIVINPPKLIDDARKKQLDAADGIISEEAKLLADNQSLMSEIEKQNNEMMDFKSINPFCPLCEQAFA